MNGQKHAIYEFDNFRLDAGERQLLRDGVPVYLSSRALDLLLVLVENNGHLLDKEELYSRVWQDQIVEESNLSVHISAIRRALGESRRSPNYIGTVIGSGYRFTADVRGVNKLAEEESRKGSKGEGEKGGEGDREKLDDVAPFSSSPFLAFPLSRFALILIAALLMVGVIGFYMLYAERSAPANNSASEPRQQMAITRITGGGRQTGAPAISPDGKFIAFIENASVGAGTLYVQQTDTNTVLQLLEPADRTFGCINFSPDGSLIYYVASDRTDPVQALYSVPVIGGIPKRIIGEFSSCFALAPDGRRVAFWRTRDERKRANLTIASLDGGGEMELSSYSSQEFSFGLGLAWSPDGALVAVGADTNPSDRVDNATIVGIDSVSGAMNQLSAERFANIGKMSWTSDGRNLVFVGKREDGEQELFLMDHPSGVVRQITSDLETYGNYGLGITADSSTLVADIWERVAEVWSLDVGAAASTAVRVGKGVTNGRFGIASVPGGRIAYIARTGNNLDLWTVNEDGTQARALTADSFTQKDVAASPDGRYLVFSSDSAGENHIFRMNAADGSETTQLTFGAASDSHPNISPDGEWVVYASSSGKQNTIWKVPLTGGPAVQLTDYEANFPVFSPDGKTIACVQASDSRDRLGNMIVVSSDGGQPLKSFQVLPFSRNYQTIRWLPNGKAVVFINWQQGVFNLWQQPISGGAPTQLTNFSDEAIWNFNYSTDGKRIFLSRGKTFVDVVLIRNFR